MRILIDGTSLCDENGGLGAGIEHYSRQVVSAMLRAGSQHEFFLFVPPKLNHVLLRQITEGKKNVTLIKAVGPKISFVTRHLLLPFRFWLHRPDVVFFPSGQIPFAWRGASVITVHDLAIYEHPEWFPQGQDYSTNTTVPKSIERANRILAVSKATKQQIQSLFPDSADKIEVVYEGVDPPHELLDSIDENDTRFPFDRDYIFYLGTLEPRKNLVNAMKGFSTFLHLHPELVGEVRFVIAGKLGWNAETIKKTFAAVNAEWKEEEPNGVIAFLGPVTEREKWNLLAQARCLLFPSLHEGFGLPVLEAMSVGVPVITTQRGALPEVAGDAAMYIGPDDIEQMSLSIAQCLLVPEGVKQLVVQGVERAREFTWQRTAEETLKHLEEVVQSKIRG